LLFGGARILALAAGLAKLFVLLPNGYLNNPLRIFVPSLCAAVVAGAHGNGGTTENVTLIRPLVKRNLLISGDDASDFAKIAALRVIRIGHSRHPTAMEPCRSLAWILIDKCELLHIWPCELIDENSRIGPWAG
jgi:hypothetical protein